MNRKGFTLRLALICFICGYLTQAQEPGGLDPPAQGGLPEIPVCKPGLFDCRDQTGCISASWVCDGELDCGNGLDERQSCCAEGKQFECVSDGLCVDNQYTCDSFSDCKDSSDELNCTKCADDILYHCASDRCIDPVFVCDHDNDCGDFSDELSCDTSLPNTYFCQNQKTSVAADKLCDGVNDCGDMSDEIGCSPCEAFHFSCRNNEGCVLVFDLCDGIDHCSDSSDESWCKACSKSNEFLCDNGDCIRKSRVCNSVDDCGDRSDEADCDCTTGEEFECVSGIREFFNASTVKCIPRSWVCDNMDDCVDGEDEDPLLCGGNSPTTDECKANEFECGDGVCILNSMVCDGISQCSRGEDELSCPQKCPSGTYQLCVSSDECLSYDQFCDGYQDCADNSDESFTNGFCYCSGVLCGEKCVPIGQVCDSTWDCKNGEDEKDCTKCRPNLHNTKTLTDQTIFVMGLVRSTYTQLDNFEIYFAAVAKQWNTLFGDSTSPFHIEVQANDPEAQKVVEKAQSFLISIVSLRPSLRQFISVMQELGFTDKSLPKYEHSRVLNDDEYAKRYILERSGTSDLYNDLTARCDYLRQKSMDAVQVLSAITKTLHFDFTSCRETDFLVHPLQGVGSMKRSMRDVFTALTLVQNNVPKQDVEELVSKLYDLDKQITQLVVSVRNFDYLIAAVAFLIDNARQELEEMIVGEETHNEDVFRELKRDGALKRDYIAHYKSAVDKNYKG